MKDYSNQVAQGNTGEMNFGQISNGKICSCGGHHGVGEWGAEKRAAIYRRLRDKTPRIMTYAQKDFLATWERAHGHVVWTEGAFITSQYKVGTEERKATFRETIMGNAALNAPQMKIG